MRVKYNSLPLLPKPYVGDCDRITFRSKLHVQILFTNVLN